MSSRPRKQFSIDSCLFFLLVVALMVMVTGFGISAYLTITGKAHL